MSEHYLVTAGLRQWTLTIVAPAAWINANDRNSRWEVAANVKLWRDAGHTYARAAKLPTLRRAHILAVLHFTDRRRRDPHNFMPTLKALVDGLVDHGLLADDSWQHLDGPDVRMGPPIASKRALYAPPGRVVLTIKEVA